MAYTLNKTWQILGPFPIGTREQDFGADPLENYGGFSQLKYSTGAKFPSELAVGGFVGWQTVSTTKDNIVGPIDFPNIRWNDNNTPFSWSIEQYQAWARGILIVNEPIQLTLQIQGASEFYVNDTRYHGDAYSYGTTAHFCRFDKGKHTINVRMIHDVRIFGGDKTPPQCQFSVVLYDDTEETLVYPENLVVPRLRHNKSELLMPDYLSDIGFAGSYGSASIQNASDELLKVESVTLCIVDEHTLESRVKNGLFKEYKTDLLMKDDLVIVPGQIRPIGFRFQREIGSLPAGEILRAWVRIGLRIGDKIVNSKEFAIRVTAKVNCVDWTKSAFVYTFLDYDNTVHYAVAKRPLILNVDEKKPIIVALHGAGVEADSKFWVDSVPAQKFCWIIFPTGRTPWGFDWHGPSTLNMFQSIEGLAEIQELLPPHIDCMDSTGGDWVNVSAPHETLRTLKLEDHPEWTIGDKDRLIVLGHSNGGQGVWHLAVHYPDKIVAVVPAAGYTKIQDYVSFSNWVGYSYGDPLLKGILESSIAEYNNDLQLSNMTNMAVLPRLGVEDDNVPPLHTRKYVRILNGLLKNPTTVKVSEAGGQGHWWDTVFSDKVVQDFLRQPSKDTVSDAFCITLINPATNGSVNGILVEQMMIPYRLGKIKGVYTVTDHGKTLLTLKTTNISSFRFTRHFKGCQKLLVDGDKFSNLERYHTAKGRVSLTLDKKSQRWKLDQVKASERTASNYGPIHRMYESPKPLIVVVPQTKSYDHAALQITHDWYLYGGGDAMIVYDDDDDAMRGQKGVYRLYLGLATENKRIDQIISNRPCGIEFEKSASTVVAIRVGDKLYRSPGTGILFMQPGLQEGELAVIISGVDSVGFESACRLLPKRTGMMVPEWIITSDEMKATGIGGVLGAGYFDNEWKPFGYL